MVRALRGWRYFGGAWTEIGDAKMAAFSTRVSEKNGQLTLTGAKYYTTGSLFADWIDVGAVNGADETVSAVIAAKARSRDRRRLGRLRPESHSERRGDFH